ncbi:BLUF domain-containing protein [uncultured Jannaschia sp.]|uniref:BLUF domain-containing protein n=1 Tax=uncultured Jannaschia sp. TaxID=293347 RepID=UPI00261E18FB|nr:BLUF domain-containing protein [uncultured Jannaschia sp.]
MTILQPDLLRLVYFSRNRISRPDCEMIWEIDQILETSQVNNGRAGVTGALIFNDGVFGQVLEGPKDAVEETFERIQLDERHHDVTLLDITPIDERSFADWSMGFVGSHSLRATYEVQTKVTDFDISRLDGDEIFKMLLLLTLKNEVTAKAA